MNEIKYRAIAIRAEDGRPLSLSYLVLEDKTLTPERYGVKVAERNSGEFAQALDLTTSAERIYELVDKLVKNMVTPTGLTDVVADWL